MTLTPLLLLAACGSVTFASSRRLAGSRSCFGPLVRHGIACVGRATSRRFHIGFEGRRIGQVRHDGFGRTKRFGGRLGNWSKVFGPLRHALTLGIQPFDRGGSRIGGPLRLTHLAFGGCAGLALCLALRPPAFHIACGIVASGRRRLDGLFQRRQLLFEIGEPVGPDQPFRGCCARTG